MSEVEFGYAITSHSKALMGFAMKLTKDYDQANDLLQETYFKAIRNKDKFREGTNLAAWLYTIMRNAFITNYQKMMRQKTFVDTTEDLHHLNTYKSNISNEAIVKLSVEEIEDLIDNLEERFREPFIMYYRGFKYEEIAERLDIPLGTVKNRIHVARKELQYRIDKRSKRVKFSLN
jgi:RNA polymerase sigma-70 factor (ECF subfamily)